MKSSRRAQFSSSSVSSTSTVTYTFLNEHSNSPKSQSKTTSEIPIHSPSDDPSLAPTPIVVHLPIKKPEDSAALRIQSAYRSYIVRTLVKKISAVNSETSYWERLIQRQVCCFSYFFLTYLLLHFRGSVVIHNSPFLKFACIFFSFFLGRCLMTGNGSSRYD